MKKPFLICVTVLLLIVAALLAFGGRKTEPNKTPAGIPAFGDIPKNVYDKTRFYTDETGFVRYGEESLVGVDVSSHQKEIDWQAVKAAGVDFAILRVAYRGYTSGGLHADPCFEENLRQAKKAGLKVGVYLFSQAVFVEEAAEEAEFLLLCLDGTPLDLPVYFDWEYVEEDSRTKTMTSAEITAFAETFCAAVEKGGYEAGVYFNQSLGYLTLNLGRLKDYDFWLAQYTSVPDFYFDFDLWQYTAEGTVPGIQTPVDLNVWFLK